MDGLIAELSELIHLKRYAHRSLHREKNKSPREIGNYSTKFLGRGMDFSEVRNYQAGDEIRHMEWRITARTGRPYIKLYEEERERPVIICCDFSSSMFFGTKVAFKSVIAARLAALISWTSIVQSDKIGGLIYSEANYCEFPPRGKNTTVLPFLAAISQETQRVQKQPFSQPLSQPSFTINDTLERLKRSVRPGALVVIISDFYFLNQQTESYLSRLAVSNPVIAYSIFDLLELSAPQPGHYPVSNGQNQFLCDMTEQKMLNDYQSFCSERQNYLKHFFKQAHIQQVSVTTTDDLPQVIRKTFPGRRRG